ncbi:MAG: alanine dehydrogenase [Bacteroidia bacterium]|nr:NAD(P)-dependent oxidoreductase [Bacteroidia bacterium]MCC6767772.1 alanine dehydrogenase [Bacteroidia bacterium]
MVTIGIIREEKKPYDKRVAFLPEQCTELTERFPGIRILVQPSPHRCVADELYAEAGFELKEDLSECDILFGVKEVPVEALIDGKTYLFFSHTIKKQPHNRKLLRTILQKNIRLIDYETLVWHDGGRVLGFGRYAGIVGTHNGFLTFGRKTGNFDLQPAWKCANYKALVEQYRTLSLPPVRIALCGDGRVAHGCLELLRAIGIREVTPQEFLEEQFHVPVYVHLRPEDFYAHKDGEVWDKADFYHQPENYISSFRPYTRVCDLMINAIFWHEKIPRFFSKEDMKARDFQIKVIADISCDINGSIPATLRDTTIEDPVFGYHPLTESEEAPYLKNTIDIMAVGNLPCELPYDASKGFGEQLLRHVMGPLLGKADDPVIQGATLTHDGKLLPKYAYLHDYVA